jgi:hypothetical protein
VDDPYTKFGLYATIFYFAFFFVVPIIGLMENNFIFMKKYHIVHFNICGSGFVLFVIAIALRLYSYKTILTAYSFANNYWHSPYLNNQKAPLSNNVEKVHYNIKHGVIKEPHIRVYSSETPDKNLDLYVEGTVNHDQNPEFFGIITTDPAGTSHILCDFNKVYGQFPLDKLNQTVARFTKFDQANFKQLATTMDAIFHELESTQYKASSVLRCQTRVLRLREQMDGVLFDASFTDLKCP